MKTLVESLREIIGYPDFFHILPDSTTNVPEWDYGAIIEYLVASMLVIIVVGSVFKIITHLFRR